MESQDDSPDKPKPDFADDQPVESQKEEPEVIVAKPDTAAKPEPAKIRKMKPAQPSMTERQFRGMSRRELLKVASVIALGAFVIPGAQEWLLKQGLGFSDWASARLFR